MMRNKICLAALLFIAYSFSYCQSEVSPSENEELDILYVPKDEVANDSLQRLHLVLPEKADKPPLFIWIGGGAWSYVDRDMELDLARRMAAQGIAVACVGHRLSTAIWRDSSMNKGIKHPEHIKDVAMAVKWLYTHHEDYHYDPEQIFIGGFSSGAHLAALISLDPQYLQAVGLELDIFKGVVPVSGTYDIVDYHRAFAESATRSHLAEQHVQAVFGDTEAGFIQASPVSYLENLATPMLIITDGGLENYTRLFEARLRETDFTDYEIVYALDFAHAELWRDMSHQEKSDHRERVIAFIREHS